LAFQVVLGAHGRTAANTTIAAVGDFGLCFFEETGERFTLLEEAVGPRWYMAPELESGRVGTVLPASDVYSLGKLLYWMLATRIFARERHRELEYDLSRDPSDFGMRLVYELLDRHCAVARGLGIALQGI
jgi:serine/threonine protein kinase